MHLYERRAFLHQTLAAASVATLPGLARAQISFETGKIIVGFPAGGTTDAVSRRLAEQLRPAYAKTVLVENKPGAGGRLGVEALRQSPSDGTTMLLTPASILTLSTHIYQRNSFDIFTDLTPVSSACSTVFAFGVGPAVPESVKTLRDFTAWAQANPDKANYGSPATGSTPHFIGALMSKEAGVELRHIPYRGSAPGIQDLLGGQVSAFSSPVGDYLPHLKTGKLRVLATSGRQRSRFVPDVATYVEQGFKRLEFVEWYGLFMPGKTPAVLVDKAAAAVRQAMAAPALVEGIAQFGLEPATNTPAELARALREENAAWGPIVKSVGFTPEA